jgi:hypothetical protein
LRQMYGKVLKMSYQKFFRTECAGQVYNFTYKYGCTGTAVRVQLYRYIVRPMYWLW